MVKLKETHKIADELQTDSMHSKGERIKTVNNYTVSNIDRVRPA